MTTRKTTQTSKETTKTYYATGRRKTSSARVFLKNNPGSMTVNKKPMDQYLKRKTSVYQALEPLMLSKLMGKVDIKITVSGGGESGQAGAIRHGLSRALVELDPELRGEFKKMGFLTRDARMVERKKYGLRGARKRFQYSKR